MTETIALYVAGALVVVLVVWLLRHKNFALGVNRKGVKVNSSQPEPRPGIEVDGATSRAGKITLENHRGDGLKAKGLDAAGDVTLTNRVPPKA